VSVVTGFSFDSILNAYLIEHCGLDPPKANSYGLVVHSHIDFMASIAYPAVAELALRVNKLGRSSVTYEIAIFEKGVDPVRAVGEVVHVFVERATGLPSKSGMPAQLRQGLERIQAASEKSKL
jgi:acyl-CoA thioester hydrolase